MKKVVIVFIVVAVVMTFSSQAQMERANIVLGNGLFYNSQYYQGIFRYAYLDVLPFQFSESAALGLFGLGIQNSGVFGVYQERSYRYGGGLVLGLEPKYLFYNADTYIDFKVGYMFNHKDGHDNRGWRNEQDDQMIYLSTYAHIDDYLAFWFYRHKLFIAYQQSWDARERSFWEEQVTGTNQPWDVSGLQARFEESIFRGRIGYNWSITPKAILGYSYELGSKQSYFEPGFGFDIYVTYYQNLLDVNYQYKMPVPQPSDNRYYHMIEVNINLIPIIKSMRRRH